MGTRAQGSSNPRILKGKGWIKGCMHALACNDSACSFSSCKDLKSLLLHLFSQPARACNNAASAFSLRAQRPCSGCGADTVCFPVRALLSHWVQCQDPCCEMCTELWAEISMTSANNSCSRDVQCMPTYGDELSASDQGINSPMEGYTNNAGYSLPVISMAGRQDTASAPYSPGHSSCMDAMLEECSRSTVDQSNGNSPSPACDDHSESTRGGNIMERDLHFQVIYFLELLLQCLVQKLPINEHPQDQLGWLSTGKQLWQHLLFDCASCASACPYPGCKNTRAILCHRVACQTPQCAICTPVKQFFQRHPAEKANVPNVQDLAEAIDNLSL